MTQLIGLTGGIATGKSTVTAMLRDLGAPVVDADQLARDVVAPGTDGLKEIAARWPAVVVNGVLDRKQLGAVIFSSSADRAALNAITHPKIQALALEQTTALYEAGHEVVVYDAALLIENRLHEVMNGVILVVVAHDIELERLMARDRLSRADAEARIAAQMPLVEKRKVARWIIDNSGTRAATQAQVVKVWQEVSRVG